MKAASQTWYILFMIFLVAGVRAKIVKTGLFDFKQYIKGQMQSKVQEKIGFYWSKGIVPYYLDNNTYDYIIADRLRAVISVVQSASCVRFKPLPTKPDEDVDWIHITNPQGERKCTHAPIYMDSGEIVLVLGFDCLTEHEILHTLLHTLGFHDEVTHPQRDQYIRVLWNNIQPEYRNLYRLRSNYETKLMLEYDPLSIMHFHDRAFSMNGQATIMPRIPGLLISPSEDLSQLDKMRLHLLTDRECNKRKVDDLVEMCKMVAQDNYKETQEDYEVIIE